MRRRIARLVFVVLLGTVATVLGTVTAMILTPPGRDLLARSVSTLLDRKVLGRVDVGYISGSFLYDLTLKRLVVRDTAGIVLANLPQVRVSYRLPTLLAGDIVLTSITLDRPVIQLIKHRNGRMNYEEVFRLGKGAPGGRSPLVELRNVRINDGTLRIALPWNPPKSAVTERQRDSALAAERAKPGRRIEPSAEGLRRVILFESMGSRFARLRVSTPDRKPFTIDIDSLATRISDPQVTLRDLAGRLRLRGDSAVFSLSKAALPNTVAHGGGAVTWPRDTILFDYQVVSPQVDLADLRWVSPDFPSMTGRGTLAAHSATGGHVDYVIEDLRLRGGRQRVEGRLIAMTDVQRGFGVRDLRLTLNQLDLDAVRPYLDTLPFHGTITGQANASGYLDAITMAVDWDFADALVPERPVSHIVADGRILTGGGRGLTFDRVRVRDSDIDLRTVRKLAPAVIIEGRLAAVGTLNGPMRNVDFTGTARQQDDGRPPSTIAGHVHLDTRRDTLGLATDVTLAPLSFEGIRRAFPSLKSRGELRGTFRSQGTLAALAVDANLEGEIGAVTARGTVALTPPRWGADTLTMEFSRLDLQALRGGGPRTALHGALTASGSIDTLRAPEGTLRLALARSGIREFALDTLYAEVAVHDSVIQVDSAYAEWNGARAGGSGNLGWAAPHTGRMAFKLAADSLTAFDSLLLAATRQTRDTTPGLRVLNGTADAALTLSGSLDTLQAAGDFVLRNVEFQQVRAEEITGTGAWIGGHRPSVRLAMRSDSILGGKVPFRKVAIDLRGPADSVAWAVGTGIAAQRLDVAGRYWTADSASRIAVDTLLARLATHQWRLAAPAVVTLADSTPQVTPLALRATDGAGAIDIAGTVPGKGTGSLTLDAFDVSLQDIASLVGRDTGTVAGNLGANLQLGGRAAAPTIRGTVSLSDGRVGEARPPYLEGVMDYANQRLDANLALWKTGERVLQIEAQLPIDLAFEAREKRQLDGPLHVRARADSVSLSILEAMTTGVRRVSGALGADVNVVGQWDKPELSGFVEVRNGAMSLPGLNVRYQNMRGRVELAGDSLQFKDMAIGTDQGRMLVRGQVYLHKLSKPELALRLQAQRFRVIDVRNLLSLVATGYVDINGPFYGARVAGDIRADEGVLYFADLISKRIIDLDDPTVADLVDTTLIRRRGLGSAFQTRFLQELRIDNLHVDVGNSFWLRSGEANIALTGDVRVAKAQRQYRLEGTLQAERGLYSLKVGPVTRDFTVSRGTVRYFGTPDLNAELDIEAQHLVRTVSNQEVPIIARIRGTLLAPQLTLESTVRPPIAEADLVSYLITGAPVAEANVLGQGRVVESALSYFFSAFSSELERAIVSDFGLPVDLVEIRPGAVQGAAGSSFTQLTAGWQIGNRTFFTLNAGFCPENLGQFTHRNLGASLERRFSKAWRAQLSVEPTLQSCVPGSSFDQFSNRAPYQVGFDVFWEREF